MKKSLFVISSVLAGTMVIQVANAAYPEIKCEDSVFTQNSCNQCFDGGQRSVNDAIGGLSDIYKNAGETDMLIYGEEQQDPYMLNLGGDSVNWTQVPGAQGFWELTNDLKALENPVLKGYLIPAKSQVTRIKSKEGYGYRLEKNTAEAGTNIGLLVYPVKAHVVNSETKQVETDGSVHRECVLIKSAGGEVKQEEPTPITVTPTGPEHILLLGIALLLALGYFGLRTNKKAE